MSLYSFGKKVCETVLAVSVLLVYGIGPVLAVEIEHHHHHVDGSHEHSWLDLFLGHHGDHCNDDSDNRDHHHPSDSPCEHDEGGGCAQGSGHAHVISLGTGCHAIDWSADACLSPPSAVRAQRADSGQVCPDGPLFDVLKPPQLR